MKRAITLARRGMGRVSPNPLVGAVLVKNGRIVAEGHHLYEKKHHAEVVALERAGRRAAGASLYLNLEPCTHQGRTPPCVDRILEARVAQVYVAVRDPNPQVAGKGIRRLRKQGIPVDEGLCRDEAIGLNEKYLHFTKRKRPLVLLKLAMTLDGKIATGSGQSQWITAARARKEVHRLRYEYDALLVGVNTLLKDNPSLDVRWTRPNSISKVILDSRLRTPPRAKVFNSSDRVVIFCGRQAAKKRFETLSKRATVIRVSGQKGQLSWKEVLAQLGQLKITSLMIEGGSQVVASALRARIVQKINFFYGPRILGGSGLSGIEDLGIARLKEAIQLDSLHLKRLGPDFLVEADVKS
jgi:diaminohydroxyphosphoribosylaminopyrimidine deaminase/5-amino-6-(5-phosphoribosylamino)uracil reductase